MNKRTLNLLIAVGSATIVSGIIGYIDAKQKEKDEKELEESMEKIKKFVNEGFDFDYEKKLHEIMARNQEWYEEVKRDLERDLEKQKKTRQILNSEE